MPGNGNVALPGFVVVTPGSGVIRIIPVSVCHHVSTTGRAIAADVLAVPHPGLGVDRLPDRTEDPQRRQVVLRRELRALLHERADRGRRAVQDRDLVVLDDLPPAVPGRRVGRALVQHAGRRVGERPVDDVAVAGDPADVRGAPVHVVRLEVEDHLVGVRRAEEVAGGRVQDPLRLGGRPARVEQVEHVLRVDRHRRAVLGLAVDEVVPPVVAPRDHVHAVAETVDDEHALDRRRVGDRLVGVMLQVDLVAAPVAAVRGDQHLGAAVVDAPADSDSAEKPPKTTVCGAPIRAQASIAIGSSGIIGM